MTRKWFISLLSLGAAGQTTVRIYSPKNEKPKPRNGECPVCGTMEQRNKYRPYSEPAIVSCEHCRVVFRMDAEDVK